MADLTILAFLSADERSAISGDTQQKIASRMQEQQTHMGSLEPMENVRRRVVQVENRNLTLLADVEKAEKHARDLEKQLNDANESKMRAQCENSALKEQNVRLSSSQSDWQQELGRLKSEKTDLSTHVVRCDRDAQRHISTIFENQGDINRLTTEKAEKEAQNEQLLLELAEARESVSKLDALSTHLRTQSTSSAARASESVLALQKALRAHAEEVTSLKRDAETYKQQADISNRDRIQVEEQARILQEKHTVTLQRQEEIRKQFAEKFDSATKIYAQQTEQMRSAQLKVSEEQHRVETLESTIGRMEQYVAGCDSHYQLEQDRFAALEQDYKQQIAALQMRLNDSEKSAEMAMLAVTAAESRSDNYDQQNRLPFGHDDAGQAVGFATNNADHSLLVSGGMQRPSSAAPEHTAMQAVPKLSSMLRDFKTKCNELRLIRQENDALHDQVRALSERGGAEWPLEERESLNAILNNNRALKNIFRELIDRCDHLDNVNAELHTCCNSNRAAIIDYKKRLDGAEFRCSCLSQQVRYLSLCAAKLQGADVSFEDNSGVSNADGRTMNDTSSDDVDKLTEEQRNTLDALSPAASVFVGLKQQSIDEIRRHYVRFSSVRELQLNNIKLIEAIYQLEANDVLRGGNVGDLNRELRCLRSTNAVYASRFEEASRQFEIVVRERDAYRHLCDPQLQSLIQPLLTGSPASLASLTDILSSPKILDIFNKLNQNKQAADVAAMEQGALIQLLESHKARINELEREFAVDREQWQQKVEDVKLECRNEHYSAVRSATEVASLETERAVRIADLQTATDRVKEAEAKLVSAQEEDMTVLGDIRRQRGAIQSLELNLADMKHENAQLKNELDHALRQEADTNAKYAAAKARVHTLLPLQKQLDDLRAENTTLAEDADKHLSHVETTNRTLTELQARINVLETGNDVLKSKLAIDVDAQKTIVASRISELQDARKQLTAAQTELKKLCTQYSALLAKNDMSVDFHQEYEDVLGMRDQLSEMNRLLNDQLAEMSDKLNTTEAAFAAEKAERVRITEEFSKRLDEASMGSQSVNTVLRRLQADKNQLARNLAQRDATVQQLTQAIDELKQQINGLSMQLQEAEAGLAKLNATGESLQLQVTQLTAALNERDASLQQLQTELEGATKERDATASERTQAEAKFLSSQSKWTEMEADYIVQRDRLRRDLDESRRVCSELRSHLEREPSGNDADGDDNAVQVLNSSLEEAGRSIAGFENELAQLRAKYAVLQRRLAAKERAFDELRTKSGNIAASLLAEQQQQKLIALELENAKLKNELDQVQARLATSVNAGAAASTAVATAQLKQQHQQQLQKLHASREALQRRLTAVQDELKNVRESSERLSVETDREHQATLLELASQNDNALATMQKNSAELQRTLTAAGSKSDAGVQTVALLDADAGGSSRGGSSSMITQREGREQRNIDAKPKGGQGQAEQHEHAQEPPTGFSSSARDAAETAAKVVQPEQQRVQYMSSVEPDQLRAASGVVSSKPAQSTLEGLSAQQPKPQQMLEPPATRKRVMYDDQPAAGSVAASTSSRLPVSSFMPPNNDEQAKRGKLASEPTGTEIVKRTNRLSDLPGHLAIGRFVPTGVTASQQAHVTEAAALSRHPAASQPPLTSAFLSRDQKFHIRRPTLPTHSSVDQNSYNASDDEETSRNIAAPASSVAAVAASALPLQRFRAQPQATSSARTMSQQTASANFRPVLPIDAEADKSGSSNIGAVDADMVVNGEGGAEEEETDEERSSPADSGSDDSVIEVIQEIPPSQQSQQQLSASNTSQQQSQGEDEEEYEGDSESGEEYEDGDESGSSSDDEDEQGEARPGSGGEESGDEQNDDDMGSDGSDVEEVAGEEGDV